MKRILFIGRWSPFHNGHKTIIDSFIDNGKAVCIAIRDSEEKYPLWLRYKMIRAVYKKQIIDGSVQLIHIPDIEGVAIGRKVGYYIVEVPEEIKTISGTKIREGVGNEVPPEVKDLMDRYDNHRRSQGDNI